jgi:hypothetical protein
MEAFTTKLNLYRFGDLSPESSPCDPFGDFRVQTSMPSLLGFVLYHFINCNGFSNVDTYNYACITIKNNRLSPKVGNVLAWNICLNKF